MNLASKFGPFRAALLASPAITSSHYQLAVDCVRDGLDTCYTGGAVQATTSYWGANNTLADFDSGQDGSNLAVFLGGSAAGAAYLFFIDSKPGSSYTHRWGGDVISNIPKTGFDTSA